MNSPIAFYACEAIGQNGWLPTDHIRLPIGDIGFRQGVTAVERMRTYSGVLFGVDRHLERLRQTLDLIGITDALPIETIPALLVEVVQRNSDWITNQGDVGLTIWATPGNPGSDASCSPGSYAIHLNPIDHSAVDLRRRSGQPVVLTDVAQPSPRSWSRWAKVRSRLHYFLADQSAQAIREDSTGILNDEDGTWTESSVANLALVIGNELVFAPPEQVLCGVTQSYVYELAIELGFQCRHQRITTADIAAAQAMLLMGTDTGLWFASEVIGQQADCVKQFELPSTDSIVRKLQSAMPQKHK